jgi:putative endonuclease
VKGGYIYIVASKSRVIYTGVTSDLERRIWQHKHRVLPGFASRYFCTSLVLIEDFPDIEQAIAREKEIKGWLRSKKVALIELSNPHWSDMAADWYE